MVVKLTILIKKHDDYSDEEFHKYWAEEHCKVIMGTKIAQEKMMKYTQTHVMRAATDEVAASHSLPFAKYDGYGEIWANSLEDLLAIAEDEEYNRVVVPDEKKFTKRDEWEYMLTYDEPIWENGKLKTNVEIPGLTK